MRREHFLAAVLGATLAVAMQGCGAKSLVGPQGPAGPQGQVGQQGQSGNNGSSCSVTTVPAQTESPNGGSLISCTDGTSNLVLNGTNGNDGKDAVPPQVANPVQLCTGTTAYSSKFVEVAFCINNNLYAVYSQNGGFMTEIPPGQYSSNGINSSCNFTVHENCKVTQ